MTSTVNHTWNRTFPSFSEVLSRQIQNLKNEIAGKVEKTETQQPVIVAPCSARVPASQMLKENEITDTSKSCFTNTWSTFTTLLRKQINRLHQSTALDVMENGLLPRPRLPSLCTATSKISIVKETSGETSKPRPLHDVIINHADYIWKGKSLSNRLVLVVVQTRSGNRSGHSRLCDFKWPQINIWPHKIARGSQVDQHVWVLRSCYVTWMSHSIFSENDLTPVTPDWHLTP